jgi:hypothetical protein
MTGMKNGRTYRFCLRIVIKEGVKGQPDFLINPKTVVNYSLQLIRGYVALLINGDVLTVTQITLQQTHRSCQHKNRLSIVDVNP